MRPNHLVWWKIEDQMSIIGRVGDKSVIGTNLAAIHSLINLTK